MNNEMCRAGTGQACRQALVLNRRSRVFCECSSAVAEQSQHHQACWIQRRGRERDSLSDQKCVIADLSPECPPALSLPIWWAVQPLAFPYDPPSCHSCKWGKEAAQVWHCINARQVKDHEVKITSGCAHWSCEEYFWLCSLLSPCLETVATE